MGNTPGDEEPIVFHAKLGWMALTMRGDAVRQLSFGHPSAAAAARALGGAEREIGGVSLNRQTKIVVERLQRYAEGEPVDFGDVPINFDTVTGFQVRVLKACKAISYGQTRTYGELAAMAGAPRAARAVGNCMACNRVPLIIPCHRVVRAGGDIGPYSAAGGSATKRRLLKMEGVNFSASTHRLG